MFSFNGGTPGGCDGCELLCESTTRGQLAQLSYQLNLQENMNARYCKYELHVVAAAINSGERALIFMRMQAQ
jgi:hypothetical protein